MLALCVRTSSTSGGDAQAGGFPQTDLCCACRGRRRRPQAETAAGPSHSAGFVPRRACQIQICAPVMATRDSTSRPTQPFGNGFCGLSDARMPGDCCLLSRHTTGRVRRRSASRAPGVTRKAGLRAGGRGLSRSRPGPGTHRHQSCLPSEAPSEMNK